MDIKDIVIAVLCGIGGYELATAAYWAWHSHDCPRTPRGLAMTGGFLLLVGLVIHFAGRLAR